MCIAIYSCAPSPPRSGSYEDELGWGALWLYLATGDWSYINKAVQFRPSWYTGLFAWGDKRAGFLVCTDCWGSELPVQSYTLETVLTEVLITCCWSFGVICLLAVIKATTFTRAPSYYTAHELCGIIPVVPQLCTTGGMLCQCQYNAPDNI